MKANHFHVGVRDLPAAPAWLERVWNLKPVYQIDRMAILALGDFHLFFDAKNHDSRAGFQTDDCDGDFALLASRGAVPIGPPESKPYGSRAAYLKGPGGLVFEIEQASSAPL